MTSPMLKILIAMLLATISCQASGKISIKITCILVVGRFEVVQLKSDAQDLRSDFIIFVKTKVFLKFGPSDPDWTATYLLIAKLHAILIALS
jgi:hypothetical protein